MIDSWQARMLFQWYSGKRLFSHRRVMVVAAEHEGANRYGRAAQVVKPIDVLPLQASGGTFFPLVIKTQDLHRFEPFLLACAQNCLAWSGK